MIVMKFGGTSVEDAAAMRNVSAIVARELDRAPLVVVSACAGVTNALVAVAQAGAAGAFADVRVSVGALRDRHRGIALDLLEKGAAPVLDQVEMLFDRLLARVTTPLSHLELLPELLDDVTSYGERLSSLLLAACMEQQGTPVYLLDAREVLVTDATFTSAVPLQEPTDDRMSGRCRPHLGRGRVVVTQGFIGSTKEGKTTTIGRGGSDYSAAIFGASLGAEEIQIWTDVDGILTADPSILPEARRIRRMTFREAAELAYFGARVLHPKTILPAVQKGIAVKVLNSRRPRQEGTTIAIERPDHPGCIVKSIAYKEGITLLRIVSTRMLMAHGFLAKLFEVFAAHKKAVDVIATSEIGVSLTIDDDAGLDLLLDHLSGFAEVDVQQRRAVLCVVGENMRDTRGVAARFFGALERAGVNVEMVSHGGSAINLTVVIREEDILASVGALHQEFFATVPETNEIFQ